MRPVLLDLFGCEGGASHGYALAGWQVWTVDNAPARHAQNPYAWHLGDWREGLERALATGQVRAAHASPPCHLRCAGVYSGARRDEAEARLVRKGGYVPADLEVLRALLDAPPWMTEPGMFLSIPPAMTQHLGEQLLAHVQQAAA